MLTRKGKGESYVRSGTADEQKGNLHQRTKTRGPGHRFSWHSIYSRRVCGWRDPLRRLWSFQPLRFLSQPRPSTLYTDPGPGSLVDRAQLRTDVALCHRYYEEQKRPARSG